MAANSNDGTNVPGPVTARESDEAPAGSAARGSRDQQAKGQTKAPIVASVADPKDTGRGGTSAYWGVDLHWDTDPSGVMTPFYVSNGGEVQWPLFQHAQGEAMLVEWYRQARAVWLAHYQAENRRSLFAVVVGGQ